MEKLFKEAKVSDEATEALKHFSCDAFNRLKQPPARRLMAIAHAEILNGCELLEVEGTSQQREHAVTLLNIVDASSGMHIASTIPNQTSHTLWKTFAHGWLRWPGAPKCLRADPHRAQIRKDLFNQSVRRAILVDNVHAEALENHARYLRMMGNRTMEDLLIDEAECQQLLDELTDAKNNHNGHLPRQWVLGSSLRVLGHALEDSSDLSLLELESPFRKQAQYRDTCRMAAIEVEANTTIRKSLIGRSRPMRSD